MVRFLLVATVLTGLALTGCSDGATARVPVRGKVMLDKKPLNEGQIVFVTPGKPPEAMAIKDGSFEGNVEVGDRRVEIMAYKTVAGFAMEGETPEPSKTNTLHERYNTASQLRAKVTEEGPNEFTFELKSSP